MAKDNLEIATIHAPVLRLMLNNKFAVAADTAFAEEDRDILNLAAVMVHAGVKNANGDGFKQADLEWAFEDHGIFTPERPGMLDDGHDMIGYGVWTRSFPIRHKGHFAVQTEGAIWAWKYPEFARMVTNYYLANTLSFSMMCSFEFAECSECGHEFANTVPHSQYCDHLQNRRENAAIRWLRYPRFLANSRVDKPADADADGLHVEAEDEQVEIPENEEMFEALGADDKLKLFYASATLI